MGWRKKSPFKTWLEEQQELYDMTPEQMSSLVAPIYSEEGRLVKEGDKLYGKQLSPYFPQALENQQAVKKKAMEAMFEATQQGAPQSYARHGGRRTKYQDTSMLPERGSPKSDPARLQASPVGYDKDEWWRQNPHRSPVQENFSIFSMKPYSWS